ncbi:MAG: Hsp20/alpha crystallin family protein [bacterium]|nr:Hsp20/alpha crystallin family protein [bacterium]
MVKNDHSFSKVQIGENFSSGIATHVDWKPRTNIVEVGDLMEIEVELPGVNKDSISIHLHSSNELIIKGTKPQPRSDKPEVAYHLFEREFGSFYKKIVLDFPIDTDKINSEMLNGVLTIKLPRKKVETISVEIK